MTKILITGATGNVGKEVIKALYSMDHPFEIYAGVRSLQEDSNKLSNYNLKFLRFDFTDPDTYQNALDECDILFLLRPPEISDVKNYFKPLINTCIDKSIKHIVFLSVQGIERSKIIPHHKIESLIVESKIPYTFLRPAYFIQNFTTTLHAELVNKKRIFLPAGNAKFTLVDIRDIGLVAASVLTNTAKHINRAYELTSKENLTFSEMASILSTILATNILYTSPNLLSFFLAKRMEKTPMMFILVMIMLHYLPRFQKEPEITDWIERILSKSPTTFEQFVKDHKNQLTN